MKRKLLAMFSLALLMAMGCTHLTPEQQREKAADLYQQADTMLSAFNPGAQHAVAQYETAVDYLKESDALGYEPAAWRLAGVYRSSYAMKNLGNSRDENLAQYRLYLNKAASAGISDAQAELADNYAHGDMGYPEDHARAIALWEQAAESGNRQAMRELVAYYYYKTCDGCQEKYVYWMEQWSEGANAYDQAKLGIRFENGDGFPQDYGKAAYWYQKAADQGSELGYHYLGHLYLYGKGVSQDFAKAGQLMAEAADRETWGGASHHLGEIYYYGLGVKTNYQEAFKHYMQGAEEGYYGSMYMVAYMYQKGQGVKADRKLAREWYEKGKAREYNDGYNDDKYLAPALKALNRAFK